MTFLMLFREIINVTRNFVKDLSLFVEKKFYYFFLTNRGKSGHLQNLYSVPNIRPFCILGPKYRRLATKKATFLQFKTAKKDKIGKQGYKVGEKI